MTDAFQQFITRGGSGADVGSDVVRPVVVDSWRRSTAAGINPDHHLAPRVHDPATVIEYRSEHLLSQVFPLLYDVLGRAAVDCDAVMAVGDASGELLWVCGSSSVLRSADRINFVEGSTWSESAAGTNAPGVALHLGLPAIVRGGEHFSRLVHRWSCAAAPIHDPVTGRILGVVDITGGDSVASPQSLAMIHAAARMAESELARIAAVTGRTMPLTPWTGPAAPGAIRLATLGLTEAVIEFDGRAHRLSPRHSEIVVGLCRHPDGCTAEQLEVEVYPGGSGASTLRVEIGRLRALLGEDVLVSRPYRLTGEAQGDWQVVEAHLRAGRVREALAVYAGPLLPASEAPAVVDLREALEASLRLAVLRSGQVDLMTTWTRSRWGAVDLEMWERQSALLPFRSPLHAVAEAQVQQLRRAWS